MMKRARPFEKRNIWTTETDLLDEVSSCRVHAPGFDLSLERKTTYELSTSHPDASGQGSPPPDASGQGTLSKNKSKMQCGRVTPKRSTSLLLAGAVVTSTPSKTAPPGSGLAAVDKVP
jgi:hypothetical protein